MATEKIKKVALRAATLEKDVDVESRKVNLCFMTESLCRNWYVPEVCLCKEENVDLTRFNNGIAPVLFNHDRDEVIGRIETISFENNRANATIVFDNDEKSNAIFQKVQSGSLRGVSVGYIRQNVTRVEGSDEFPVEFMGRSYNERTDVTTKWELLEISIVSVPADNDTGVGRDLGDAEIDVQCLEKQKEIFEMENKQEMSVDIAAERENAISAERERASSIMELCRSFEMSAEAEKEYLANGYSVDKVRSCILDEMAKRAKPSTVKVEAGEMESEKIRKAIVDGLCLRHGYENDAQVSGGAKFAGMSLRSLAEDVLEREGDKKVRYATADQLFERAMGSGAFVGIMDDFANKVKLSAVKEQPFIWRNFVSFGTNSDFKPNYKYEMGLDGLPVVMPQESAEFKAQEMIDAKVSTNVATYGKAIKFTREIFINDQLGQVADAIALQTGGFERLKEKLFFQTLVSVTYSQNRGNVATTTGITAAVYDELTQAMMTQKDIANEGYIGVAPAFIVAPVNQRIDHKILLNSSANIGQNNPAVINPVQGDMQLFVSPYLTGNYYYAIARPGQMRGIEFTSLAGNIGVQSRTVVPSSYLGIEYQLWEDFGFNVLSYKAFARASKQ